MAELVDKLSQEELIAAKTILPPRTQTNQGDAPL